MYYSELQRMQKLLLQIIETYILSQKNIAQLSSAISQ